MTLLRQFGRALLLLLVRILFRAASRPGPSIDAARLSRVLVIRTDPRVGNVLLTTPLVRALREGLPGARVDWLVAEGKQALVLGLAHRVLPFRKQDFFLRPWRFISFLRDLRRERYDAVVEAGHWHAFSFTSAFLARATGSKVRIGHDRGLSERFLTHPVPKDPGVDREVPAKLELLRPLGLSDRGERLETTVDAERSVGAAAERIIEATGRTGTLVALNPGARKADHRWPAEAFGQLAARLVAVRGAVPLVLWGPGEEALAREVVAASAGAAVLAPPTNLAVLAGVFRRAGLVVTNDTGPMHLAAATGAKVLAVLLAEDGSRWSHTDRFTGVAVRDGSSASVERVLDVALDVLGENRT
jgi:ADP-heptose:LPS heptosyltransferase